MKDGSESIDNFKMARRCTIPMPYDHPLLLESYADYFIAGAYGAKPFQVDIFDRSKASIMSIDTGRELRRALKRRAIADARITSLDRLIVPRLKWSDRACEVFEQKKRAHASSKQSNEK